jgi:hypothetical protein
MKDDRLRQPIGADYAKALGDASFCFSILEWNVVWACERIEPGSLRNIVNEELTAGKIAKRFLDLVRNMPKARERQELTAAAQEFNRLVGIRNCIVHGKPCTGPSGEARLSSQGVLEISDLEEFADSFSACGIEVNRLLHGYLATYMPAVSRKVSTS